MTDDKNRTFFNEEKFWFYIEKALIILCAMVVIYTCYYYIQAPEQWDCKLRDPCNVCMDKHPNVICDNVFAQSSGRANDGDYLFSNITKSGVNENS